MVMLRNEPMKTFKDGSVITVIRVEVGERSTQEPKMKHPLLL